MCDIICHMIKDTIRNLRLSLGLSQQKLAELSGVSIATIQNLESNKSNPRWDVLEKVFKALNFDIQFSPQKVNWERLAYYGLGVTESLGSLKNKQNWDRQKFVHLIIQACIELKNTISKTERERVALEALIFSVKNHYPTFFLENLDIPIVREFVPNDLTGKHIKLYRYSKNVVSQFL